MHTLMTTFDWTNRCMSCGLVYSWNCRTAEIIRAHSILALILSINQSINNDTVHSYYKKQITNRTWSTELCHYQWPWMTLKVILETNIFIEVTRYIYTVGDYTAGYYSERLRRYCDDVVGVVTCGAVRVVLGSAELGRSVSVAGWSAWWLLPRTRQLWRPIYSQSQFSLARTHSSCAHWTLQR